MSSWLSDFEALIKMYPKFKLNFFERSISKQITKIVHSNASFGGYCDILIQKFEGNFAFLVNIYFITSCNISG